MKVKIILKLGLKDSEYVVPLELNGELPFQDVGDSIFSMPVTSIEGLSIEKVEEEKEEDGART